MKIFFDKKQVNALDDVFACYSTHEFESPTRSTVPLLSLLQDASATKTLLQKLDLNDESLNAHLEYQVRPSKGDGKASHTDLMLIQNGNSVAIEAKWTEPPYDSVEKWVQKGARPKNRREVLRGWIDYLQRHTDRTLDAAAFGTATYQIVHRAASACAACDAGGRPSLGYIQFSPLPTGVAPDVKLLETGLSNLFHLLGAPAAFPFFLIEVTAEPTAAFEGISKLSRGLPETAKAVCTALRSGPLFKFTNFRVSLV